MAFFLAASLALALAFGGGEAFGFVLALAARLPLPLALALALGEPPWCRLRGGPRRRQVIGVEKLQCLGSFLEGLELAILVGGGWLEGRGVRGCLGRGGGRRRRPSGGS